MISTGKVLEWENTDSVGIGKTKFSGTNLRMSHSLTKAECGNVLQRTNHRKFRKWRWNFPTQNCRIMNTPILGTKGTLRKQKMVKQIHSTYRAIVHIFMFESQAQHLPKMSFTEHVTSIFPWCLMFESSCFVAVPSQQNDLRPAYAGMIPCIFVPPSKVQQHFFLTKKSKVSRVLSHKRQRKRKELRPELGVPQNAGDLHWSGGLRKKRVMFIMLFGWTKSHFSAGKTWNFSLTETDPNPNETCPKT